jgi:Tol biopolymer transport system component
MIRPPVSLQDLRKSLYIKAKTEPTWASAFAVSPNGRHLAFSAAGSDGVVRLWVRALDSLEARPLLGTESKHIAPFFWSPDSRFIAWGALPAPNSALMNSCLVSVAKRVK